MARLFGVIPTDPVASGATSVLYAHEPRREMHLRPAQGVLLAAAAWLAWRPFEVFPWSAVIAASVILTLTVWGWQRPPRMVGRAAVWTIVSFCILVGSGLVGHDPSAAISKAFLVAIMTALMWLASREAPPDDWPALLALSISGLAIWGVLQVTAGPEHTEAILLQLPEPLRAAGSERLAAGRAFASQPLPSHLAVLLATALPLLLGRLRRTWKSLPWLVGAVLCFIGLGLTRSPIGVGLALAACAALALTGGGRAIRTSVVVLALVLAVVVVARGDVLELEPVSLRLDNWRTAVWVWSTSPAAGVGFGGFGQVAQTVPFAVGNRPRFAHSLPLEWLAELGPLGLLAVLTGGFALWRLVRDLWPSRPDLAVAVAVVPAHNLVDFSLHGSGVALPWAVLVGWAMASRDPTPVRATGPPGRPFAVAAAAVAVALSMLYATSTMVMDAAAVRVAPEERYAGGLEARRLAPWRAEPLAAIAVAALESGDPHLVAQASNELEKGRWLRPYSSTLADLRSHLDQSLGRVPSAVAEAWAAQRANPGNEVYRRRLVQLYRRLQIDGSGADD